MELGRDGVSFLLLQHLSYCDAVRKKVICYCNLHLTFLKSRFESRSFLVDESCNVMLSLPHCPYYDYLKALPNVLDS